MTATDPSTDGPRAEAEGPSPAKSAATRRVARNTAALVAADSMAKLSLFVLYAIIARSLGTGAFGEYTLAVSLAFFVRVSALGTDLILSREVARAPDEIHGLFWDTVALKLATGLPVLVGVVAFAVASSYSGTIIAATALIGFSNLIDVLGLSLHSILRGREQMGSSSLAMAIENLLIVCLGAVALAEGGGLVSLGVVYVLAAVVALLYIWLVAHRRGIRPRASAEDRNLGWLLRAAAPTGLAAFFGIALARVDAVILAEITDDNDTVGLYGAAYRIFESTLFVSWGFGLAIYPMLSRLGGRSAPLKRVFELGCMAIAAVTVPLGAAMALYGPTIVDAIFGGGFGGAGSATRILGGAAAMYGVFSIASLTVAGQDQQRKFPLIGGAALAVNLLLNFILIPPLSLDGAAIAMTGSQLVATVLAMWFAIREVGGFSTARAFGGVLAGLAAMALPLLALDPGGIALSLSLLAFGAVFLAVEWAFHRDDLELFVRSVTTRGAGEIPIAPKPSVTG